MLLVLACILLLLCVIATGGYCVYLRQRLRHAENDQSHARALSATERQDAEFHRISSENADTGLLVQELDGTVRWVNTAYLRMTRRKVEDVIGNNPMRFAFPPENQPTEEEIANFRFDPDNFAHETNIVRENIRGDGTRFWVQVDVNFYTRRNGETLAILTLRDVSERIAQDRALQASAEKLVHAAAHDDLTGAANRARMTDFLTDALHDADANGLLVGVLHIDMDNFKQTNDTFGHAAGDAVLVATSERLRDNVRDKDLVARIGGDEFVVVCTGLRMMDDLQTIGDALINATSEPIQWQNHMLNGKVSIGAALSNHTVTSAEDLLSQSDFALYEVKKEGRGRLATYDAALHQRNTQATRRRTDLRQAIHDNALTFHYHPIVGQVPDGVLCLETLVRWNHPTDGLIPPYELIPLAESLGMLADLDFLAMNAAMDMKLRLNDAGYNNVRTSFNASPDILARQDFRSKLLSGLAFRELNVDDVVVEVLETVAFEDQGGDGSMVQVLADLSAAGAFTVLDDFGSGNAGIAKLSQLSIQGVKFDKSIGVGILNDHAAEIVYKTLIDLCNQLNLRMVTEGVETAAQAKRLRELGCTSMQGFLFAKPLPADDILDWLEDYTASAIAPADTPRYLKAN